MPFVSTIFIVVASLSSNPMFSIIITCCSLIILYLPSQFFQIVFSPVLLITGILLGTLLHFRAIKNAEDENTTLASSEMEITTDVRPQTREETSVTSHTEARTPEFQIEHTIPIPPPIENTVCDSSEYKPEANIGPVVLTETEKEEKRQWVISQRNSFPEVFVEWDRRSPLEVIYEEYEGEEEEDSLEYSPSTPPEKQVRSTVHHLASLAHYYPDSDGSSSDDDFPAADLWNSSENFCFQWEEGRDGLIEIPLNFNGENLILFEEENLIEIDPFSCIISDTSEETRHSISL